MTSLLRVSLNDDSIGTLTLLPSGGVFFAFDEAYLNAASRPVLSQSFFKPSGKIIPECRSSAGKLPPFFSNLLPEGHMRDYLAQRGGIKPSNEFNLIKLLGQDLSGAIILSPLEGAAINASSPEEADDRKDLRPLRFSLAGVQLKFSAIAERRGGACHSR
jgi:serine/threonine-protein kinase HipA